MFLLASAHSIPLLECANPSRDSCSFYADCLESQYHCGPAGYPIGYGQKFCQKFSDRRSELSPSGQTWMLDTMHCLQTALIPEATGEMNKTCDEVRKKAFGTHAECYVDTGVCMLPLEDWLAIVDIVDVKTLFASWDAFDASVKVGVRCLEFRAFLVRQNVERYLRLQGS
jgi:Stanniocalcin family.